MYNLPETTIHTTADTMLGHFKEYYEEFRQVQVKSAISTQKRSKLSLGALISENKRQELLDTLLPSRGTLLIVPHTLVQHWEVSVLMLCIEIFDMLIILLHILHLINTTGTNKIAP